MMSFAAVLELVTVVAYLVVVMGGKQKRESGWRVLAFLLVLVAGLQCAGMSMVVCVILSFFVPTISSLGGVVYRVGLGRWKRHDMG